MFRGRDIVAAFFAVLLTRMAWTENYASESLSSTLRLAFYKPWKIGDSNTEPAPPVPLDVDGDGTVEAVVVANRVEAGGQPSEKNEWVMEVIDLKPLHKSGAQTTPILPKTLFQSQPVAEIEHGPEHFRPLKMITGHIVIKHPRHHYHHHHHAKAKDPQEETQDDRSRHFFCGRDWHDATNNCHQHCPGGTSSECPEEMMCYADTMCDALRLNAPSDETDLQLELTPGGGLPSVATLWSDGTVTLHSITADAPKEAEKHRGKRHHSPARLELREMWRSSVILKDVDDFWILEEYDLLLLGAEDIIPLAANKVGLAKHGMLVVGGSYSTLETYSAPFMQALDALKGELLWEKKSPSEAEENTPAPRERGSTSIARRRSRVASLMSERNSTEEDTTPNCLGIYRHSLLDANTGALPFVYWGTSDSRVIATHLSRHRHSNKKKQGRKRNKKWPKSLGSNRKKAKLDVVYGRPNVLISHLEGGLSVRSLKNGRTLCHLSLVDEALYADINKDGVLDQIQVITDDSYGATDPRTGEYKDKWVSDLARRVEKSKKDEDEQKPKGASRLLKAPTRLCHVLALSGLPPREELFSAHACPAISKGNKAQDLHLKGALNAAPPLVVERIDTLDAGKDFVVAVSAGAVTRFQSSTGKRQWQVSNTETLPTWGMDYSIPLLSRVDFLKATYVPWIRPILVTGEDSMALLSAGRGRVLASTSYPQTSIGRPILGDLTGDGTTDVMIISADAIWGYQVVIRTGGSIVFRIMVGLLFVGVAIAFLRNQFGQRAGVDKRSTDAS